jgi:hypothetical protein
MNRRFCSLRETCRKNFSTTVPCRQVALEPRDVLQALLPDVTGHQVPRHLLALEQFLVHPDHEHLLVVRPVVDPDAAPFRNAPLVTPQEVMVELFRGRLLEGVHLAPLRVHAGHDVADGAVLTGRVHRLEHQEHRVTVVCVELVLLLRHPLDPLGKHLPGPGFRFGPVTACVARVDVLQAELVPLGDAIGVDELFDPLDDLPLFLVHLRPPWSESGPFLIP